MRLIIAGFAKLSRTRYLLSNFLGIAPGRYQAVLPAFISGWDAKTLKARVAFAGCEPRPRWIKNYFGRRYRCIPRELPGTTLCIARCQAPATSGIVPGGHYQCLQWSVCGIRNSRTLLLDAAHIIPDNNEQFGQPVIPNGIPLSKIHHAAFDRHLIGIDPDYHLHVSGRLLDKEDGPLLDLLKGLTGRTIHLPLRPIDRPDQDRLAMRFEHFKGAA